MKTQQAGVADILSLAEYRHDLAIKLWREGKFDEAKPLLREAIDGAQDTARRLAYINTLSIVEQGAARFTEAIQYINAALPEAMAIRDEYRLAKLHMTQGINYRCLGDATHDDEPRRHALIHFAGAAGFFKKLNDYRHVSMCENNLANVLVDLRSTDDALFHVEQAIKINKALPDRTSEDEILLLVFYDTRSKARLAISKTREDTRNALGDALKSCLGLHEAEETNFLNTSLETLRRCLQQQEFGDESERLQKALDQVGGHPKRAADLLRMNHGSFIRLADKHPELRRKPKKKPRGRTCKPASQ